MNNTAMNTQAAPRPSAPGSGFKVAAGILGVLALLGLIYFIESLINGHESGGVNDTAAWGIYIVGMILLLGISIGSTVIGALINVFGKDEYMPLGMRALIVGLVSLVGATLFVAADVGNVFRMVLVPFIWNDPTSMFVYTSLSYYIFGALLIVSLVYTVRVVRGESVEASRKHLKVFSAITVLFAILLVAGIDGTLFAINRSRELWNHASLPIHFADVSVLSGIAVMLLIGIVMSKRRDGELVRKKTLTDLSYIMLATLSIAAFFDVYELLIVLSSDTMPSQEAWKVITGGNAFATFLHVGGYIVAFLILITKRGREDTSRLSIAATAVLVGVIGWRYSFIVTGLAVPLLPFINNDVYTPTWPEIAVTLGILSLISLAYLVLVRKLPMEEDQKVAAPSPPPRVSPAVEQQTA